MVMINNVDYVLALVRGQIERMSQSKRTAQGWKTARSDTTRATETSRLRAISNLSDISDDEFEHLLVGALLAREFGEDAAQDPRFQSVVDRTAAILRTDESLRAVMQDVRRTLRKGEAPAGRR